MRYDIIMQEKNKLEASRILECNEYSKRFGVTLCSSDVRELTERRQEALKEQERVEFGRGILPELIYAFCDSPHIYQDNYAETLARLQEIFYEYKNESMDELTDDELISYMKEHFDGDCQGSLEYLEETCLERLSRIARHDFEQFVRRHTDEA